MLALFGWGTICLVAYVAALIDGYGIFGHPSPDGFKLAFWIGLVGLPAWVSTVLIILIRTTFRSSRLAQVQLTCGLLGVVAYSPVIYSFIGTQI